MSSNCFGYGNVELCSYCQKIKDSPLPPSTTIRPSTDWIIDHTPPSIPTPTDAYLGLSRKRKYISDADNFKSVMMIAKDHCIPCLFTFGIAESEHATSPQCIAHIGQCFRCFGDHYVSNPACVKPVRDGFCKKCLVPNQWNQTIFHDGNWSNCSGTYEDLLYRLCWAAYRLNGLYLQTILINGLYLQTILINGLYL
ncbi:hypothetical protein BDB00DRAFT_793526 [Zychaea mexicana]|uniref:uncharacterized protein n=1 Tax=Zychaea mexicana TaxID=64656 RepID=UPI0022FF26C8|nr:uncharacterized protein BDB00DRAFT_793526 [Zychaea mexicana]KAI9472890.1 hypothetical protein BDB00DRAFT_793526 [Zychaea mexicana]